MARRRVLLALLALIIVGANSEFLDFPFLKWQHDLRRSGSRPRAVREGNAVVISRDGSRLFVTTEDGSLHILKPDELEESTYFEPGFPPGVVRTTCTSGVALVESPKGGVEFAVYAVTDTDDEGASTSRVIAVDPDGAGMWSIAVNGVSVGTPFVSADGSRVYVTHNEPSATFYYSGETTGRISILQITSRGAILAATLPGATSTTVLGPLTAPTGRTIIERQDDDGGSLTFDVVVVAQDRRLNAGATTEGALYAITQSARHEALGGVGEAAYDLLLVSDYPLASSARPCLSASGTSCYLGQTEARVTGWDSTRDISTVIFSNEQNVSPRWEQQLTTDRSNPYEAILTTPVLSPNEQYLFVTTSAPQVACLSVERGRTAWMDRVTGTHSADPVVSNAAGNDQMVVYFVEAPTGVIRQYDVTTGGQNWEMDCFRLTGDAWCRVSVEAHFSMSTSSNTLFYAYTNGTIVALTVGRFRTPPPTLSPVGATEDSASPSPGPTKPAEPTAAELETTTAFPTDEEESGNSGKPPAAAPSGSQGIGSKPTLRPATRTPTIAADGLVGDGLVGDDLDATLSSSAAKEGDSGPNIVIILATLCGVIALLVLFFLICICRRKQKRVSGGIIEEIKPEGGDTDTKWQSKAREYEQECAAAEEETLKEILQTTMPPQLPPKPPPRRLMPGMKRSNSLGGGAGPPLALDAIQETPEEADDPIPTDSGHSKRDGSVASSSAGRNTPVASQASSASDTDASSAAEYKAARAAAAAANPTIRAVPIVSTSLQEEYVEVADLLHHASLPDDPTEEKSGIDKPATELSVEVSAPATPEGKRDTSCSPAGSDFIRSQTMSPSATIHSGDSHRPCSPPGADFVRSLTMSPGVTVHSGDAQRPSSPTFSDIYSVDSSLYVDDASVAGDRSVVSIGEKSMASRAERSLAGERSLASRSRSDLSPVCRDILSVASHPDDERSVQSGPGHSAFSGPGSHYLNSSQRAISPPVILPGPPPMSALKNTAKPTVVRSAGTASSVAIADRPPPAPKPLSHGLDRATSYNTGKNSRPKAGLFTRRAQVDPARDQQIPGQPPQSTKPTLSSDRRPGSKGKESSGLVPAPASGFSAPPAQPKLDAPSVNSDETTYHELEDDPSVAASAVSSVAASAVGTRQFLKPPDNDNVSVNTWTYMGQPPENDCTSVASSVNTRSYMGQPPVQLPVDLPDEDNSVVTTAPPTDSASEGPVSVLKAPSVKRSGLPKRSTEQRRLLTRRDDASESSDTAADPVYPPPGWKSRLRSHRDEAESSDSSVPPAPSQTRSPRPSSWQTSGRSSWNMSRPSSWNMTGATSSFQAKSMSSLPTTSIQPNNASWSQSGQAAWDSFLSELAKAEDQFFNPTRTQSGGGPVSPAPLTTSSLTRLPSLTPRPTDEPKSTPSTPSTVDTTDPELSFL